MKKIVTIIIFPFVVLYTVIQRIVIEVTPIPSFIFSDVAQEIKTLKTIMMGKRKPKNFKATGNLKFDLEKEFALEVVALLEQKAKYAYAIEHYDKITQTEIIKVCLDSLDSARDALLASLSTHGKEIENVDKQRSQKA